MLATWEPGTVVFGEFVVERHLGSGGFGRVDLVRGQRSGQPYAVKRVLIDDPLARGRFLAEAQRWIGLPAHENIVACHFVRNVGQELAVFSEFVAGGSLAGETASGRLLADTADPLYRIIDIAVQAAWGIDAAHAMGLLHLDVKPGNILLTADGTAKITDFGLASTRERSAREVYETEAVLDYLAGPDADEDRRDLMKGILRPLIFAQKAEETIEGRAEGVTVAYASPEQAEGRRVGRGSDVWSWGLVVLEMFAGRRSWPSGTLGAPVLERVAHGTSGSQPRMPPYVHDLLRRCFRDDPAERPSSLRDIADELIAGVTAAGSERFRRPVPPRLSPADRPLPYQRMLASGTRWEDPRQWLDFAYRTAGLDPELAIPQWPTTAYTPRSMALGDLAAFLEARRVLDPVASEGPDDVRAAQARLHAMIGMVRRSMGDELAAIEDYRSAAAIDENIDSDNAREDLVHILVGLSIGLRGTGDAGEAVAAANRAMQLVRQLPDRPETHALAGMALQTMANAMPAGQERISQLRSAVAELERSGDQTGLIRSLGAEAAALGAAGLRDEADATWRRLDALLDDLTAAGDRRDLLVVKGQLLLNRAAIAGLGPAGIGFASQAAEVFSTLVERGHYQLSGDLGTARFQLAKNYEVQGQIPEAVDAYRGARLAFEQAVLRDGQVGLVGDLAEATDHESTLVAALGNGAEAIRLAESAVGLWARVAALDDSPAIRYGQAEAHSKLAARFRETGNLPAAREHAQQALTLLDCLAQRAGQAGDSNHAIYLARANAEMAAVERAEGDPVAGIRRLELALQAGPPADQRARILTRLGNALSDLHEYERAIAAFEASMAEAEGAIALNAAHGRINALFKFGAYESAITAAEESLSRYSALIATGRADLRGDQARLQVLVGQARLYTGDLPAAVAAWRASVPALAEAGGAAGASAASSLTAQANELEELLSATPDDVPAHVERLRTEYESAVAIMRSGQLRDVPSLFENPLARGLALCEILPADPVLELCGEIGLAAGLAAMRAGREAAAARAFDKAGQCFKTRYDFYQRMEGIDRWCDARGGIASVHVLRGDEERAAQIVSKTEAILKEIDPGGVSARLARMHQMLASVRDSTRQGGGIGD